MNKTRAKRCARFAAHCDVCGKPAIADCCANPEPIVKKTTRGVRVVCPDCGTRVECCIEPDCEGKIVPAPQGGAR